MMMPAPCPIGPCRRAARRVGSCLGGIGIHPVKGGWGWAPGWGEGLGDSGTERASMSMPSAFYPSHPVGRFGTGWTRRWLLRRERKRRWCLRDLWRHLGGWLLHPEPRGVERRQEEQGEGGGDQQAAHQRHRHRPPEHAARQWDH